MEYLWFWLENLVFVDGDYSMCLHKQEQEAVVNQMFWSNIIHLVLQTAAQERDGGPHGDPQMQTKQIIFVLLDQLMEVCVGKKTWAYFIAGAVE